MAEAEFAALTSGHAVERGVWLSEEPVAWAETGFGKAAGRQLAYGADLRALRASVFALRLASPRIGISARRVPRNVNGAQAAKRVVADCIDGDVDYRDPTLRLLLVVSSLGYRLLVEADAGDGAARRQRLGPFLWRRDDSTRCGLRRTSGSCQ